MDKELFLKCGKINTSNVSAYLIKNNWKKIVLKKTLNFEIFQNKKGNTLFQISLPLHQEYDDYQSLIYDSCITISEFEDSDPLFVVDKLLNPDADIIKVRASNEKIVNGTMQLDDALSFFDRVKRILADAATDTFNKTKHRTKKYSGDVSEFLSRCRFGQTEVGSYVVSVICPHQEKPVNNTGAVDLFGETIEEEDSTRRVIKKLIKSAKKVSAAIDNNEDLSSFVNREDDDFISLNFIEDLGGFSNNGDDSIIEFGVEFSNYSSKGEKVSAIFETSKNPVINKFVNEYKKNENEQINRVYIIGFVSKVSANPILENRNGGEATVNTKDGKSNYRVVFSSDDYARAVEAHKNGLEVIIDGTKKNIKVECIDLTVLQKNELFSENNE